MSLLKCEFCGKPFNSFGTKLCSECMRQVDSDYVKIRKYIYQSSDELDFASIIENTEVSEKSLNYLIDQGRIVLESKMGRGVRCRACGAETSGDILCERCRSKLVSEKLIPGSAQTGATDTKAEEWRTKPLRTKHY